MARTGKMSSLTFISSYSICHSWKDGWLCKSKCAVVVPHQVIWDTLYVFVNSISTFLSKGYFGKFNCGITQVTCDDTKFGMV